MIGQPSAHATCRSSPRFAGDEHLSTIYYAMAGELHVYPSGCDGPSVKLLLAAGDLLVMLSTLVHAGPPSPVAESAHRSASLSRAPA